ncbi:SH3 domain-containing protein [Celeribacter neptunius]|uniref:SH3 domain-containing protein n=1 Tax=Celeribacter neptunius TaxID=588602 RepID=A0A1I3LEH0_9RHOB|nr:SH3 domain-containing protein [Celeribacter neptunius]SFI82785.1 SH3 domain-containing protein [Celeribacter neptunius]
MKHSLRKLTTFLLITTMAAAPMVAFAQSGPRPIQQQRQMQVQVQDRYCVRQGVTLNGRAGPGTQYHKMLTLRSGTQLKLLNQQRGWAQVETPQGERVWVSSRYLMCDGTCGLQLGTPRGPAYNR